MQQKWTEINNRFWVLGMRSQFHNVLSTFIWKDSSDPSSILNEKTWSRENVYSSAVASGEVYIIHVYIYNQS